MWCWGHTAGSWRARRSRGLGWVATRLDCPKDVSGGVLWVLKARAGQAAVEEGPTKPGLADLDLRVRQKLGLGTSAREQEVGRCLGGSALGGHPSVGAVIR